MREMVIRTLEVAGATASYDVRRFAETHAKTVRIEPEMPVKWLTTTVDDLGIAVGLESGGLFVQIGLDEHGQIVVGANTSVTGIDVASGSVRYEIDLTTPFYELEATERGLVVLYETGALLVDVAGRPRWHVTTDLVTDWHFGDHEVTLETADGVVTVDSESGDVTTASSSARSVAP